jgi:sugar (pentulose or hexulose) kinase
LEKIELCAGRKLPRIVVIGGGSKDDLVCRFTSNVCARQVCAGAPDSSALGNISVQMIAYGELSDISQARDLIGQSFPFKEYEPCEIEAWNEVYVWFLETFAI